MPIRSLIMYTHTLKNRVFFWSGACFCYCVTQCQGSRGLMDRALDLKPEVTQGCEFKFRLWQEVSVHDWGETLEQGTDPPTAPRAPQCWLPTAPGVCALGWVKCREHISLLIILCIIVYVTNKAHLSLICICCLSRDHLLRPLESMLCAGVNTRGQAEDIRQALSCSPTSNSQTRERLRKIHGCFGS